jgi:hypothetical protein
MANRFRIAGRGALGQMGDVPVVSQFESHIPAAVKEVAESHVANASPDHEG